MNQLLSLQLLYLFKDVELTELFRESDQTLVKVLKNIRLGTVGENIKHFKARFIDQSDKIYPHDTLHIYAENASTVLRNQTFLNNLPGEVYSTEANGKIPDGCRYPSFVIQTVQNKIQINKSGLAKLPQQKIDAKVMLT